MIVQKEAIEQIQKSANIPAIIEQLKSANTQAETLVVPNDFKIVDLEPYMANRNNYRLQLNTVSIEDYIQYGLQFQQENSTCFINASQMSAATIFDLGDVSAPLHQEHRATLSLEKTAPFRSVLTINGEKLSQKHASEFLEDWADFIQVFDQAGNTMTVSVAAQRLRNLTIEAAREVNSKVSDYGEQMSAMERIEAQGQDSLPHAIRFNCVPYSGLKERSLELRVGILTGSDKPAISIRIVRLEVVEEELVEEFKQILVNGFKESEINTYIGTVR